MSIQRMAEWLNVVSTVHSADAIIVLGGDDPARTVYGISLYNAGFAPEFWHTGDTVAVVPKSDARLWSEYAIQQGVSPTAVNLLRSTSTWEDGQAIAALATARGMHSLLIVTDWTHVRRAQCVIKHQLAGTDIQMYFDSPPTQFGATTWWQSAESQSAVLSELVKNCYYAVHYGLNPWHC